MHDTDFDPEDYPLPDWAIRRSDGNYMEAGAQLCTRDGRRLGNAFVECVETHERYGEIATVTTDMGNTFRYTLPELQSAFYPPSYVMDPIEARKSRKLPE